MIERLFSIMGFVKTRLRYLLAIQMVEAILAANHVPLLPPSYADGKLQYSYVIICMKLKEVEYQCLHILKFTGTARD